MQAGPLSCHLLAILGRDGFVALTQAVGGTRVYVAYHMRDDNEVVQALGRDLADKLCRAMAPANIRVPLARRERALHYRTLGQSDAQIARRLGITESGVNKLWRRETGLPDRGPRGKETRQLSLF